MNNFYKFVSSIEPTYGPLWVNGYVFRFFGNHWFLNEICTYNLPFDRFDL